MNAPATTIERAAKERPILFSGPMVRAILDGRKTMTRRIVTRQSLTGRAPIPATFEPCSADEWPLPGGQRGFPALGYQVFRTHDEGGHIALHCPFGVPGDRLWCREEHYRFGHWEPVPGVRTKTGRMKWRFVADTEEVRFEAPNQCRKGRHHKDPSTPAWHKRLARFMPRTFSRISLEVTGVRVERLQAISEEDALAEGCELSVQSGPSAIARRPYATAFAGLWDAINGAGSWASNPWVWCVSFRRVEVR